MKFDVCIIGSGAGAGPVAYELSNAGFSVVVLEKGPWYRTSDFTKDEMTATRRNVYTPNLRDEQHVLVTPDNKGNWKEKATYETGKNFWNGSCVGGSSNFMSAYFHRLKPIDFKLLSEYGPIEGANIEDWPITYEELEPYYEKVERIVGVSGKVVQHSQLEPRSTEDFPYPPLKENIFSSWLDAAAKKLNYEIFPTPRGILSENKENRKACYYSNYCGSYGCSSDAKGSSRVSLIEKAIATGNCTVIPNAKVFHLSTENTDKVNHASYYDQEGETQSIQAKIFVVAAQAIETSRLLLMSKNENFPNGLANNSNNVGKNLLFSAGGVGSGKYYYDDLSDDDVKKLNTPGLFINRASQQWYEINDPELGRIKGGTVDFVSEHANAVSKANKLKKDKEGNLIYGSLLKKRIENYFTQQRKLKFEIFVDWLPTDNCYVSLDENVVDKWNDPVAKVKLGYHPHDLKVSRYIADRIEKLFESMNMKNVHTGISGAAPANLQAGGCRFGNDPSKSVLDKNCKAHEVQNLYVTDGSFMPTGGSTTYTWTIYANSFRVADKIIEQLTNKSF